MADMSFYLNALPWHAEQSDEEAVTGEWTVVDAEGGLVAEVPNPYTTYEMQVAYAKADNCPLESYARLIAAAPSLHAAAVAFCAPYAEVTDAQLRFVADGQNGQGVSINISVDTANAVLAFRAALANPA